MTLTREVSGKEWASEIAKAAVWLVGLVLLLIAMIVLAPDARADSVPVLKVAAYLDTGTVIPLAAGVDTSLAENLLDAQALAWGKHWEKGSLQASEDAVLKAISLYLWPGGPSSITFGSEDIVWEQSMIAIDVNLSVGTSTDSIEFGTRDVVGTPEPGALLCLGLGLLMVWWGTRRTMADRMRMRLQSYRAVRP
jgi:hypothetical protein